MSVTEATSIERLSMDNYETWKLYMEALLIENDAWGYVSGEIKKEGDDNTDWERNDRKAHSHIILAIGAPVLKRVRGCNTSRELWLKLESMYQSTAPARKMALLTRLVSCRAEERSDIRTHLNDFFDTVDKLGQFNIEVNPDLLCVLLLQSLPGSYENFVHAIKSKDDLPTPETLRVKITEEADARTNNPKNRPENALRSTKNYERNRGNNHRERKNSPSIPKDSTYRFRCSPMS